MVNVSRRRSAALGAALLALAGCSTPSWMPALGDVPGLGLFESPRTMRGHHIDDEDLRQITVGVSTSADVGALLGSPTASGTFDDDEWYYISAITHQRPGRTLGIEDQQVVLIRFNPAGVVQEVRRIGQDQGRNLRFVTRETPSPGNERTFLQQLFGNIGRLGPGVGAAAQQQGPGAPGPGSSR